MVTEKEAAVSVFGLVVVLFLVLLMSGVTMIDLAYFGVLLFYFIKLKFTKEC